jgi:hypothetical protein
MDLGLDKFLKDIQSNFQNAVPPMPWTTEQERNKRTKDLLLWGIESPNLKLVKENLPQIKEDIDIKKLIQDNIFLEKPENKETRLEILELLLEEAKKDPNSFPITSINHALEQGRVEQFELIAQTMKELKISPQHLEISCEESHPSNVPNAINSLIKVGYMNKNLADKLLRPALKTRSRELIKQLVENGADPTQNGSHKLLIVHDNTMITLHFPGDRGLAQKILLENYPLKALQEVQKLAKGGKTFSNRGQNLINEEMNKRASILVKDYFKEETENLMEI